MDVATQEPFAYTVRQVAEKLQCSTDAIYDAVRRGDIKGIKLGRSVRIPRPELERLCGIEPTANGNGARLVH